MFCLLIPLHPSCCSLKLNFFTRSKERRLRATILPKLPPLSPLLSCAPLLGLPVDRGAPPGSPHLSPKAHPLTPPPSRAQPILATETRPGPRIGRAASLPRGHNSELSSVSRRIWVSLSRFTLGKIYFGSPHGFRGRFAILFLTFAVFSN